MIQSKLHTPTLPEAKVAAVLHEMKLLPGEFEYNGQCDAEVSIDGRIPDFVNMERKVIIEVNGGFYHRAPDAFAERRAEKLSTYYANGYQVLEIWDYELLRNFDLNQLQDKINMSINIEDMH
jgi:very-short-patch-repair endonuclease